MTKPRLLIVGAFPPPDKKICGGIVTSCKALLASSFADRFELILVDSTQVSNPPPAVWKRVILASRRLLAYVTRLFRARPDAVLLFSGDGLSLLEKGVMARIARLAGLAVVHFPRAAGVIDVYRQSRFDRHWIRWVFSNSTVNCAQGPEWQRFFSEEIGFPVTLAPVILNWTATPELIALGGEKVLRPISMPVKLLFLGWLEREKGIFELLQACRVLQDMFDFQLVVAGSGRAEAEAHSYVEEQNLSRIVEFKGWVRGGDLQALLAETDVLVLPSWAEGFPNAVIEAMAAGLAIVSTTVGTIPSVLTDGREALLVPPRDVHALVEALKSVLVDEALRDRLRRRGYAFARDNFTLEPAVEKLSAAIHQAIETRWDGCSAGTRAGMVRASDKRAIVDSRL